MWSHNFLFIKVVQKFGFERKIKKLYTVKKVAIFPSPAEMSLTKLSPARESLFSDILAGDGKIANFFYSVCAVMLQIFYLENKRKGSQIITDDIFYCSSCYLFFEFRSPPIDASDREQCF